MDDNKRMTDDMRSWVEPPASPAEFVLDFEKIFNDHIEHNPKEWMYDRNESVGASEVFGCLRKALFDKRGEKLGFEPDVDFEQRWGATERGNIIENHFVVPAISHHLPADLHLHYQGEHQTTLREMRTSATPDGLITGFPRGSRVVVKYKEHVIEIDNIVSDCINFEIKSIDPMAVLTEERKKHNFQTQMQVGLIREKTDWEPHYSVVLYVNASWLDDITPFVVKFEPETYETGKERAEFVFAAEGPSDIMPEGRLDGDCKYCKWTHACGTEIIKGIPEKNKGSVQDEDINKLMTAVAAYNDSKNEKEVLELSMKAAQEDIKVILSENSTRGTKLPQDMGSISWSSVKGKKSVDTKAMAEDGIDLEPYQKTGAPYDRLMIKMKKQSKKQT